MAAGSGQRPRQNRRLVLAGASQGGEPRCEIQHDPPSFSLAACEQICFYCKERSLYFSWIYLSLDIETTSVSLFDNVES